MMITPSALSNNVGYLFSFSDLYCACSWTTSDLFQSHKRSLSQVDTMDINAGVVVREGKIVRRGPRQVLLRATLRYVTLRYVTQGYVMPL